ncbi:MAG: TatD family hydrolase, partial [Candidatus Riflebacteria bacterium]|nr:TatD family hydrolase [Candidatus Riflebacteria bacterium]
MRWFDTHCHLDRLPGALPVGEALRRAHDAGVGRFLVPGVTGMPLLSVGDFQNEKIHWAWGVHPGFIEKTHICGSEDTPWQASGTRLSAIGECGLD